MKKQNQMCLFVTYKVMDIGCKGYLKKKTKLLEVLWKMASRKKAKVSWVVLTFYLKIFCTEVKLAVHQTQMIEILGNRYLKGIEGGAKHEIIIFIIFLFAFLGRRLLAVSQWTSDRWETDKGEFFMSQKVKGYVM